MAKRKPKRVETRWYKKLHRQHVVEALADVAFELFRETGEATALLAFCDALAELPTGTGAERRVRNEPFERRLREMIARPDREDVWFFFRFGAGGHGPKKESYAEITLTAALNLRAAEQWFQENEYQRPPGESGPPTDGTRTYLRFRWEEDTDYDPNNYDSPGMPDIAFGCVLERWEQDRRGHGYDRPRWVWVTLDSLWGITFGPPHDEPFSDPHHRVVQAELALEAMPDERLEELEVKPETKEA